MGLSLLERTWLMLKLWLPIKGRLQPIGILGT